MIKKMIAILMAMGMIFSGIVFADEISDGKAKGVRPSCPNVSRPPHGHPGDLLGRYLHENMLTEALCELTGQSADVIKTALETQRPDAILESYGLDFAAFRTLMDTKTAAMAEKAAGCALITQEQSAEIAEKIAARAAESDEVTVAAQKSSRPGRPAEGGDRPRPPHGHPGDLLGRYLHENMLTEALCELTAQTADVIKTALETQRPDTILESYGVDFDTFRTLMDAKTAATAEKAAGCALITQEQSAEIAEKIAARAAAASETGTTD